MERISDLILQPLPSVERDAVMTGTAMRVYQLGS
jgi:hypothetical protein